MSTSTKVYLFIVIAACMAALYFTSPETFDPACKGHDVSLNCVL